MLSFNSILRSSTVHARAWQGMERPLRHAQRHCFSSNLHDREPEQEKLKSMLESKPSAIHLMLGKFSSSASALSPSHKCIMAPGPRSCGKSKLIKSVLQTRTKAVLIDCRGKDPRSPSSFIDTLVKELVSKAPKDNLSELTKKMGSSIWAAFQSKLKVTQNLDSVADPSIDLLQVLRSLIIGQNQNPRSLSDVFEALE